MPTYKDAILLNDHIPIVDLSVRAFADYDTFVAKGCVKLTSFIEPQNKGLIMAGC